ncbi:MAG: hypothetical protein RBT74_07020 [Tenuifilaceae bacterium]|jgi:hypothetical protein|nr:hypothetical protein [Tenuifilaceae bacterium]
MQLYEPGPYEEFVGKLSSISVKPMPGVWTGIANELDTRKRKRSLFFLRLSSAASLLLLISFGVSFLLSNRFDDNAIVSIPEIIFPQVLSHIHVASLTSIKEIPFDNYDNGLIGTGEQDPPSDTQLPYNRGESTQEVKPIDEVSFPVKFGAENISSRKKSAKVDGIPIKSVTNSSVYSGTKGLWGVTAYLNPSYSYHTSAALGKTTYPREDGRWMWAGEVQVRRKFNKNFSVISGVSINPTGQYIRDLILLQNGTVSRSFEYLFATTSYGQVNLESSRIGIANANNLSSAPKDILKTASMSTAALKQSFYHLEVPVMISVQNTVNKIDVELKVGASVGTLISNSFEVISSRGTFYGTTDGVRQINFAAIGAVSVSFPVTSGLSLVVEPNLRLGFVPISQSFNTSYPFNASVRFGVGYRF